MSNEKTSPQTLEQILAEGAGEYECSTQHPEREYNENSYKYRDFLAGAHFAPSVTRYAEMREALEWYASKSIIDGERARTLLAMLPKGGEK